MPFENKDSLLHYALFTSSTAIYPKNKAMEYLGLGLVSEAGEVAGIVKKLIRDDAFSIESLMDELGDVMWYWAQICVHNNIDPVSVLDRNMEKLLDRQRRNVISGSGDKR
jgi:NTP pyrophosphatase (non-canonical NTP hydrolase)